MLHKYKEYLKSRVKKKSTRGGYIYFYETEDSIFKIGSSSYPSTRKSIIRIYTPKNNGFFVTKYFSDIQSFEEFLHTELKEFKVNREWFKLNDELKNELFSELQVKELV